MCKRGAMDVERVMFKRVFHHEVLSKRNGRQAVVGFLRSTAEKG